MIGIGFQSMSLKAASVVNSSEGWCHDVRPGGSDTICMRSLAQTPPPKKGSAPRPSKTGSDPSRPRRRRIATLHARGLTPSPPPAHQTGLFALELGLALLEEGRDAFLLIG